MVSNKNKYPGLEIKNVLHNGKLQLHLKLIYSKLLEIKLH